MANVAINAIAKASEVLKGKTPSAVLKNKSEALLHARALLKAVTQAEKSNANFFSLVIQARIAGVTFEALVEAEPKLKEFGAYRSAKSVITTAQSKGVKLVDDNGAPRGKSAIEKDTAAKRKAEGGEGEGAGKDPKAEGAEKAEGAAVPHKMTDAEIVGVAIGILEKSEELRTANRAALVALHGYCLMDEAKQKATDARKAKQAATAKEKADKAADMARKAAKAHTAPRIAKVEQADSVGAEVSADDVAEMAELLASIPAVAEGANAQA